MGVSIFVIFLESASAFAGGGGVQAKMMNGCLRVLSFKQSAYLNGVW